MFYLIRKIGSLFVTFFCLFVIILIYTSTAGSEVNKNNYSLSVQGKNISLIAEDASIKGIIEDIGKRMDVDVVIEIPEKEKVTIKFDNLPLGEAIKRLSANYVYIMDSGSDKGNITKIVVLPKGDGKPVNELSSMKSEEHAKKGQRKPESFKFQFDPSKYMKENK